MKTVLIIAAHPDDEVLGCGGAMARLASEGNSVYTLILGEGITSRDEKRNRQQREKEISLLKNQVCLANKRLGVKDNFLYDFPDNRFDTVALLDIVKVIEKIKIEINPHIIFTHHRGDLNIDHRIIFNAVMTAFRPMAGEKLKEIYSFEVPSSTEWNAPTLSDNFRPNFFLNIADTLELKKEAMKEYASEIMEFPHPRSAGAIDINSKHWGIKIGLEAAEAFEIVRLIQ